VPWPTDDWPRGDPIARVDELVDEVFADDARYETTYAVVAVVGGRVIAERYGGAKPRWSDEPEPVTSTTLLRSWSMAKSILHAAVGLLVDDGALSLDAPVAVAEWREDANDPRTAITLEQLLEMRDGLDWFEDYVDGEESNVIRMLFGEGMTDVAGYAARRPLAHAPGAAFNYSSGTSNIVARLAGDAIGGRAGMERLLRDRLFARIGVRSATPTFDDAGTFVGSSYVDATALDFARFGLLYLRDGVWDGARVLPERWVDHGRLPRSVDPGGAQYGAHWWVVGDEHGSFYASGYEGQRIVIVPALDTLIVRLGRMDVSHAPDLAAWRASLTDAIAADPRVPATRSAAERHHVTQVEEGTGGRVRRGRARAC
jgi:CubicO group peptidase (beta-lactamase class C family)